MWGFFLQRFVFSPPQFAVSEQLLSSALGHQVQAEVCSYFSFVNPLEAIYRSPFTEIYYPALVLINCYSNAHILRASKDHNLHEAVPHSKHF